MGPSSGWPGFGRVVTFKRILVRFRVFRNVGLIAKLGDRRVRETLEALAAYLQDRANITTLLDMDTAGQCTDLGLETVPREEIGQRCNLVIIVGGDGTFLSAARSLVDHDVHLLGVNMGRLGFLADIAPSEMHESLTDILDGAFIEEPRFLLRARIERDQEQLLETVALNDIVVHKWNIARLLQLETFVNGNLVNRQRCDGLIVSTPTGSTAYALSGGGPIVHPSLDAIVLVPICPHTLSSRPIVVDGDSDIDVVVGDGEHPEAQLTCDGQTTMQLAPGDRLTVSKHLRPLKLVHPPGHEYFTTLRAKLSWGKDP